MTMKISRAGIELIKRFEGCRLTAYKPVDTEKYWTIGWGSYGSHVREGMTISQKEADQLLIFDLRVFDYAVNQLVKVTINQNQFDSLVSFAYNCGRENLRTSTLLKKVNAKDFIGASKEFEKWIHAGGQILNGLITRRKAEKELFVKPVPQPVKEKPKSITKNYTIRSGESLSKIAQREKTTVKKIMELNPKIKNKDVVFAGQVIKVPQ